MNRLFTILAGAAVMLLHTSLWGQAEAGLPAADDRIRISFADASVQDVLRSLSSMREDINIVVDPGIVGQVTIQLDDVSWDTAFKLVTDMHGLVVTPQGEGILRVHKPVASVAADLTIDLHTVDSIANLSDDEVLKLVGDPGLAPEEAREFLNATPNSFVSRIVADKVPAVDVVNELARKAALNFAFSADFETAPAAKPGTPTKAPVGLAPISLNLRNISVDDAIALIASQGKLTCINRNGVWLVSPFRPEQAQLEPLKMETFQINYLPLDTELVKILQGLCGEREKVTRGKSKILIVRATEGTIESIRNVLLIMDRPTPQVLIEARIFQVNNGDTSKIGINWQDLGTEDGFAISGTWEGMDPSGAQQILDFKSLTLDTVRYAYLEWSEFAIILHAMQSSSNVKQIANPKIICNSDEQAFIHIGPQQPIVKRTVGSGDNASTAFELDGDYGAEEVTEIDLGSDSGTPRQKRSYTTNKGYLDLGTKLTVLPSVKTEEEVYLRVMPELVRKISDETFGAGTPGEVKYPNLFRTYIRTQFTLKSGQTVAIGGLIDEDEREGENGIPLLKDIPWLGKRLFSYQTKNVARTETLIFLTVKVVSGKELQTTSGVPIRSTTMQADINRIQAEDADGAEYNATKAQAQMEISQAVEAAKLENRVNNRLKRMFGLAPEEQLDPLTEPESYLDIQP